VPPELFTEWLSEALLEHDAKSGTVAAIVADKAAQWGADEELNYCCDELSFWGSRGMAERLRSDRRPKPPSLKKQAYDALDTYIYGEPDPKDKERTYNTIRRAIEALPND
jgi:hypothetical protein